MLRFLRRDGGDQPARMPGGLTVATQQVNRAQDRERELRQHQQRRQGWLEANAQLGPQYRQVLRTLAWQRRATGLAVEADRPGYVLGALGPVPESTRGRRAWRHAAAQIEHYRHAYQITDPDRALGPRPMTRPSGPTGSEPARPSSGSRPSSAPPTGSAAPSRPPSAPPSPDLTSGAAGQARSGSPASTTRKEPPSPVRYRPALTRPTNRGNSSPASPCTCSPLRWSSCGAGGATTGKLRFTPQRAGMPDGRSNDSRRTRQRLGPHRREGADRRGRGRGRRLLCAQTSSSAGPTDGNRTTKVSRNTSPRCERPSTT